MNIKTRESEYQCIWADVHTDLVAGMKTFSHNISLSDLMSDKDYRLILADIDSRLKVFKGQLLQTETKLQFTPVGISSFFAPEGNSKNLTTYLAVAGSSFIFFYRNLKGIFKFQIPNLEPDQGETSIWNQLKENSIDTESALTRLDELQHSSHDVHLSTRSLELLSIKDAQKRLSFVEERKQIPIVISNYITCMTTLKRSDPERIYATSYIVVGTECRIIYVIDYSGSKIISKFKIPCIPFQIASYGAYSIDYKLHVATRNGLIITIGSGEGKPHRIDVGSKILRILRLDKTIVVGTIDSMYRSYYINGNQNFSISLPDTITCMESFDFKKGKYFKGVLITLKNSELRLYNEKQLLNVYKTSQIIFGMTFGKFGSEEDNLILVSESGCIMVKSLLHSNLDKEFILNKPLEDGNMNVPKKTKLYLDLIEREKESSGSMNQIFQSDLVRLRYKTLDTYFKMLKIGNAPQNYSTSSKIKLSATLQGLGPNFRLNLFVDNTGDEAICSADMTLDYDSRLFNFEKDCIQLGILVPNVPIRYSMRFRNVSETGSSGNIKIHILDKARTSPLISTTIKVPISEVDII